MATVREYRRFLDKANKDPEIHMHWDRLANKAMERFTEGITGAARITDNLHEAVRSM